MTMQHQHKHILSAAMTVVLIASATPVQPTWASGIPVFDGAGVAQAVQQVKAAHQQLTQLQSQLRQAERTYKAMTGTRGMAALLDNPELHDYLPEDMVDVLSALSEDVDKYKKAGRLLKDEAWQDAAMEAAKWLDEQETSAATDLANSEKAYRKSGERIDQYRDFIDEIDESSDPKAIADLQARIQAESVYLQNELVRLQSLQMAQAAKREMQEIREKEERVNITSLRVTDYSNIFPEID
jgi:type IV secretion system protein VirB5